MGFEIVTKAYPDFVKLVHQYRSDSVGKFIDATTLRQEQARVFIVGIVLDLVRLYLTASTDTQLLDRLIDLLLFGRTIRE